MSEIILQTPATPEDFEKYFELRFRMLRQPWGEERGSEVDDEEDTSHHLMAMHMDKVIGVARLQFFAEENSAQLRYMAVDDTYQGQGIGRLLVAAIEKHACEQGCKRLFLHARENALGFYLHLEYGIIERSYLLFDRIQHYKMIKFL